MNFLKNALLAKQIEQSLNAHHCWEVRNQADRKEHLAQMYRAQKWDLDCEMYGKDLVEMALMDRLEARIRKLGTQSRNIVMEIRALHEMMQYGEIIWEQVGNDYDDFAVIGTKEDYSKVLRKIALLKQKLIRVQRGMGRVQKMIDEIVHPKSIWEQFI